MSGPQRVVPGERTVVHTDVGINGAGSASLATGIHLDQFGVDRVVNMVLKNAVPNGDPLARVDARVVEVWTALADRALEEKSTNLTGNVLNNSGNAVPDVAQ